MTVEKFFETAKERYRIMLKRQNGYPFPWTDDPIFCEWRFCNVHREDDKTTIWFRNNVRDKLIGLRAVEATLIFRWFNRINTGKAIIDLLLDGWNTHEARTILEEVSPLTTGAYMIKTPTGMDKLDGLLHLIDEALPNLPNMVKKWGNSLQDACEDLKTLQNIGPFIAYEIVSDLRWTPVLREAKDIMTWANAGPGCARGLGRALCDNKRYYNKNSAEDQRQMNVAMRDILNLSENFWPATWRPWEMREVEHWACEYDKYQRALLQDGKRGGDLKRRFRYGNNPSS